MTKKKKAVADTADTWIALRQSGRLPPDPDGLFKRAARRGKKVVAFYEELYPDPGRDWLVANLLHDLMHCCDRVPELGNVDEECVRAISLYVGLVEENMTDVELAKRQRRRSKSR